jgi:carbon storage regulator
MLVLSRKIAERIRIGESIVLTVVRIQGSIVRLGIEAPPEIPIARDELLARDGDVSGGLSSS